MSNRKKYKYEKFDPWLTFVFIVLVIVTFVTYFLFKDTNPYIFITIGCIAIVIRVINYVLRWIFNDR